LTKPKFNSKLLLFGEYTIIDNGNALAIPFPNFYGKWANSTEKSNLIPFFNYLKTLNAYNGSKIEKAIERNLIFDSNIPQGYGLGSSGALSAAAHKTFYIGDILSKSKVRTQLAEIESFFHGSSSGLDPLTSYYNKPVLVHTSSIHLLSKLDLNHDFFLLNSKIERDSKPLIIWYRTQKEINIEFKDALQQLNHKNKVAIDSLLCSNNAGVKSAFKSISQIQFEHFKKMIPNRIASIWAEGLKSDKYYLKLAGAGGGGFFLGLGDFKSINEDCFKIDGI